jgi:hypothetical protein
MTTNELIARWLWNEPDSLLFKEQYSNYLKSCPNYEHSNSAAIELLDVLVEKYRNRRIKVMLENNPEAATEKYCFSMIFFDSWDGRDFDNITGVFKPTISEAITSAIVQLIERKGNESKSNMGH